MPVQENLDTTRARPVPGQGGFSRAAVTPGLSPYAGWKDAGALIWHTEHIMETRRGAVGGGVITPLEQLYLRNILPPPDASILADRDGWQVTVDGVNRPRSLAVAELKRLGLASTAMVLQCSGNGRGYFPDQPGGTPWQTGGAGCVIWSGVPVAEVARALGGVAAGAVYMTATGGEAIADGIDPRSVAVERSVPLEAMADALLAWELNGVPIPLAHGGPLRLVVPGYAGVNSVKYVKRLAFTARESDAAVQATAYRLSPPGREGDPSHPSVWQMQPKSWITAPVPARGATSAGRIVIEGVAFGGMHAVKAVEVSTDGGKTWMRARLIGPDLGRYAWRRFVLAVKLAAGSHTIASVAVDTQGNRQAEGRVENAGGYNNNSWRDHALTIVLA